MRVFRMIPPQAGFRAAALTSPTPNIKNKNQGAKRHLIPTKLLKTAASYIRNAAMVTPCGGWGYVPALQAGDALRWA